MVASPILQSGRDTVTQALHGFGYGPEHFRVGWPVTDANVVQRSGPGQGGVARKSVDVIAFCDRAQHDWQTSVIAVDFQPCRLPEGAGRQRSQELFRLLATPVTVIGSLADSVVDVWFSCHAEMPAERGVGLDVGALTRVFERHRSEVQRESLARLRAGQRHLFDRYLYVQRDQLAEFLERGMTRAVRSVEETGGWGCAEEREASLTQAAFSRIAFGLLAARILEDKDALGGGPARTDAMSLLRLAREKHDSFFDTVLDRDCLAVAERIGQDRLRIAIRDVFAWLTGSTHFGMVTHEMLGDLYERMLSVRSKAGEKKIKSKGAHYTPSAIASRILERIPLEILPVERRRICDFTCGSGSFLLASTEALMRIYDPRESPNGNDVCHYLQTNVLGNDIDHVSILISRLSYLLAYWHRMSPIPTPVLTTHDATTEDFRTHLGDAPTVMVGNPPFDAEEHVNKFFRNALDVLVQQNTKGPRYLGIVLPRTFLTGQDFRDARSQLRSTARLLDIWELPDRAIGMHAEVPTCVILAEVGRPEPSHHLTRVCQTYSRRTEAVSALRDQALSTWSYVVDLEQARNIRKEHSSLSCSPVENILIQLGENPRVSDIAEVDWGFTHTRKGKHEVPVFSKKELPGYVPFIRHQKSLQPYYLHQEDWSLSHGKSGERYWKKGSGWCPLLENWPKYEGAKVLVSARSNRNTGSQLVAAVDDSGVFPAKDFLVLSLRDAGRALRHDVSAAGDTGNLQILQWLCAILNSPVGQAWVACNAGPRGPRRAVFENLPLPQEFDPDISREMRDLRQLERPPSIRDLRLWKLGSTAGGPVGDELLDAGATQAMVRYRDTVGKINRLVWRAYGLDRCQRDQLMEYLDGFTDPWAAHDARAADLPRKAVLRLLTGRTISLDSRRQILTAEFSWRTLGNDKPVEIPIPFLMPGWAMEVGAEFCCRAIVGCETDDLIRNPWLLREFRPVSYQYLRARELESLVGYEH